MHQQNDPANEQYPHGRGYGHDYMRGGEVFGGYGYSTRHEYEVPRGELEATPQTTSPRRDEFGPGPVRT